MIVTSISRFYLGNIRGFRGLFFKSLLKSRCIIHKIEMFFSFNEQFMHEKRHYSADSQNSADDKPNRREPSISIAP